MTSVHIAHHANSSIRILKMHNNYFCQCSMKTILTKSIVIVLYANMYKPKSINNICTKARSHYKLHVAESAVNEVCTSTLLPVPVDCLLRRISSHALKGCIVVNANITSKQQSLFKCSPKSKQYEIIWHSAQSFCEVLFSMRKPKSFY